MKKLVLLLITAITALTINNLKANNFISKEITFNNGENVFSGTLTVPDTLKKYPAVLLVTGSGLQNRDEEIFGFKIFKMIADTLTSRGIAVLRYDDRGFGKSKGNVKIATTYDFAQDALAGIKELAKFDYIDKNNIGIFGHSEGGAISNIIASQYPQLVKFIIMMSGPALSGTDIVLSQIEIINRNNAATDAEVEDALNTQKSLFKLLKENKTNDEIKDFLKGVYLKAYYKLPDEKKKYISDTNQFATSQAELGVKQVCTPWFKYFINYEPYNDLINIKCRIIAIFGEKDTQVEPKLNSQSFEKAMKDSKNNNYIMRIFPNANHLYQSAVNGSVAEYSTLAKEFVPGFLDFIVEQIKISTK
jgi:uncharacterized protein